MAQLDALRLADALRQRLVDFVSDDAFVRDARVATAGRSIWSGDPKQGGLVSELWIEGAFPAKLSPDSTGSLADAGLFDRVLTRQLQATGAVPASRPLYSHQAEAVTAARLLDS